jgi:hypothetical protein
MTLSSSPVDFLVAPDREDHEKVPLVAEPERELPLPHHPILGLVARDPEVRDVEQHLGLVHRVPGVAVEDFAPHDTDAVDAGDRVARPPGQLQRVADELLAALRELAPGRIDARQDWTGRARRLEQIEAIVEAVRRHEAAVQEHERGLLEPGHGLVDAADRHIRAALDGGARHLRVEREVRTPGLVDHERLSGRVADLGKPRDVRRHAVDGHVPKRRCSGGTPADPDGIRMNEYRSSSTSV